MSSSIKYNKAVLKFEDQQRCVEITASARTRWNVKDAVVFVVYTFDEWKTVRNKPGSFVSCKEKEKEHLCRVSIPVNAVSNVKMWFALKLSNSYPAEEAWDNNNGWNYELQTEKLPKICLPAPPKPPASSTNPNAHNINNTYPNFNNNSNINSNYNTVANINTTNNIKIDRQQQPSPPPFLQTPLPSTSPYPVYTYAPSYNHCTPTLLPLPPSQAAAPSSSQPNKNVFILKIDKSLDTLISNKIEKQHIDRTMPLIIFSSRKPSIFAQEEKKSELMITKEIAMRGVYHRYVY